MAALRDIARDFAAEIRDGIGWTIVYRTGRSWNALTIWSDIWNGEWETDDLNEAIGILKADPDAVIVNGYYCGHFGEDMTIDEIAAGIRWHYEGGRNRLADYCEVTQGRDALEEGRKAAEAAGLPFCERLADGGDDEREDLGSYVNLFGYNPKYGVSGRRIVGVRYEPQSFSKGLTRPEQTLPARVARR